VHPPLSGGSALASDDDRPHLSRRDTWRLVWAVYAASAPYLVAFLALFLLAVWFVTEVLLG
jgi:hypothetical protein